MSFLKLPVMDSTYLSHKFLINQDLSALCLQALKYFLTAIGRHVIHRSTARLFMTHQTRNPTNRLKPAIVNVVDLRNRSTDRLRSICLDRWRSQALSVSCHRTKSKRDPDRQSRSSVVGSRSPIAFRSINRRRAARFTHLARYLTAHSWVLD